ncbi:MAG: hypothetical protein RBT25_01355, partial [Lentisphaeria bacterium]|nr:hypothetical protein [Lentisphaeria bacterium]
KTRTGEGCVSKWRGGARLREKYFFWVSDSLVLPHYIFFMQLVCNMKNNDYINGFMAIISRLTKPSSLL